MRNFLFCIVFVASLHSLAPFETAKFHNFFIFDNLAAQDFQNLSFQNLNAQITATQTHETSTNYSILQKSHEIIKLPQTQEQKGKNISAGIIDSAFNQKHPSLQDKLKGEVNNYDFDPNERIGTAQKRVVVRHGSHVAGIMLGANLNAPQTPVGVAPEANFYGFAFDNLLLPYNPYRDSSYDFFQEASQKDGVKIINNSWGLNYYPTIDREIQRSNRYRQLSGNHIDSVGISASDIPQWVQNFGKDSKSIAFREIEYLVYEVISLSRDFGILNIVASGNEGISAPGILGALPSFDESLRSIIVVGAIDARDAIINGDSIEIKNCSTSSCATEISNTFIGAQNHAITAPGGVIDSANAYYKGATEFDQQQNDLIKTDLKGDTGLNEFIPMTGTSMATPMVSGAAILVQQKYPFLSGVQIADVLLSTANKNITTPNLYVKSGQDIGTDGFARVYYNVIYVKNDQNPDPIPRDSNGNIDEAQVKKDLENLGYDGKTGKTSADYILTNLLSEVTKNDSGFPANNGAYEGIIALTKEQIFGQGILDVAKALKGIAILDANRLNSENVQNFNGKNYAFYTINTQGQSGEFSNNISQKKWDDNLHLSNALNSPKDRIRNLDVGLLKTGAGTLILSGNNSYSAPTRVNNGTLKIQGEASNFSSGANGADNLDSVTASAKGVLVNSQGFSESSGILQLENAYLPKGAVAQNGGIVLITQSARLDSEILARNNGEIRIPESSTLYLGNSTKRESATLSDGGILKNEGTLYGNIANFNGGNLSSTGTIYGDISNNGGIFKSEGAMYGNVTNLNGGVLSGAGTIYGDVANISGVVKAGFSEPTLTLDSEKTLTIQGTYSQHTNGTLMLAFDGRDSVDFQNLNTKISAQSYDIQGGELVYAPIFLGLDSENSRIRSGQIFELDLGDLENELNNFQNVRIQSTNTLDFKFVSSKTNFKVSRKESDFKPDQKEDDKKDDTATEILPPSPPLPQEPPQDDKSHIVSMRKPNAFTPQNTGNTSIGLALTQIADLQNLNEKYSTFLGNLDVNAKPKEFQETLESIENNAYLDAIEQSFNDIFAQGIENLNFISAPMNSFHTSPKTAFNEFGASGVRSDFGSSLGVGKNSSQFVINANALKLKHKQYDTSGYGGGFALKNALDSSKILGVFFDYSNTNSVHKFGNVKSDSVRVGAGLNVKLSHFDWFALGSVGYGKNASSRRIYGLFENLSGSFDNYQLSLQTGIARDFEFDGFDFGSVVLKPMASVSHTMIYQAAFSESAGILSKSYDANNFGVSSLLAGGNAQVHFALKRGASVGVGAFAFYTQRFNTSLQGSAVFSDFKNLSFSQNAKVSDSSAYFGASAQGSYGRYFGDVGLYVEQSRFYTLNSVSVNFGVMF